MGSDQGQQALLPQDIFERPESKHKTAISGLVGCEIGVCCDIVFKDWVAPQQIAVEANVGWLLEPVDVLVDVSQLKQLGRDSAMNAQVELVHSRHDRQAIEQLHEHIVYFIVVLFNALVSKSEILGHIPGLMVAPE